MEQDTDYPGADLKQVRDVGSWKLCADICYRTEDCSAWVWASPEFVRDPASRLLCWLKLGKTSLVKEQHMVAGIKCKPGHVMRLRSRFNIIMMNYLVSGICYVCYMFLAELIDSRSSHVSFHLI